MHWCSPLAHNVAAQVAGELKMIANQVHLPKNRFTTSIKRVYFVHKRRNNTHKRHFFLFVLCPPTLNIHFFSVASFISYFSVSFSGSHTTSRFLCHFQYLILHPGCSVIFSISFYIEVSPSSSVSHSISRFRYLVLHPGFSVIFSISFYIQVSLSFSVSHSTSRLLCHFQYLILHLGCSVIFSISFYIQVSLSFSASRSTSRFLHHFQYLILYPGSSISFYIQVSPSFSAPCSTSRFLCHFQYLIFYPFSLSFSVAEPVPGHGVAGGGDMVWSDISCNWSHHRVCKLQIATHIHHEVTAPRHHRWQWSVCSFKIRSKHTNGSE